jgi:alpha-1,3-rhamnosyl/mannosyltransferase
VHSSPFSLSQQWRLPALLRSSQLYHSPYVLMPYLAPVPTLLTAYDLIPLFFPAVVARKTRLVFSLAIRLAVRKARRVIAISEATRQDFIRHLGVDPSRISTVPLAPAAVFQPASAAQIRQVRTKFGLPARFLLYVGSNKPHKNLKALVQALAGLPEDIPLAIAGAWDPRYPQVRAAAENLDLSGRVRFLGPLPDGDLAVLYAACSLFIFPSLYEGFGLPVVEAMACGAPVACSDIASLPEAGGSAAAYFDPRDPLSIRSAVQELLESPGRLAEMAAAGLVQAGRFSWQQTAGATVEIYRSFTYN